MSLRWLPNAITVGRMVLALPLLWALATHQFALGFWLAVVAGASDAIDGFLAGIDGDDVVAVGMQSFGQARAEVT